MARRLNTLEDLRRYLAHLINSVEDGTMDPGKAGKLGYLCNIMKSVIEGSTLESRVQAIEAALKENSP